MGKYYFAPTELQIVIYKTVVKVYNYFVCIGGEM